ncbi:MAG: dienelactone hydrolase family protein [Thermomicrobiales bacterium]
MDHSIQEDVAIPAGQAELYGRLDVPTGAQGIVVFAHGSGSSRFSPRNQEVAAALQKDGLGTLLFDLLTEREAAIDAKTRQHRFDIPLLVKRLIEVTDWLQQQESTRPLNIGYFGASTGAAAALGAAAVRKQEVKAFVSRGGRPDLADDALTQVDAPTLLIVGGLDTAVIGMNQAARERMPGVTQLVLVEGATHLFEEPGTMEQVTRHANAWFQRYLVPGNSVRPSA